MTVTIAGELPSREEVLALYAAVGWGAYTDDADRLMASLRGSYAVFTARDDAGGLVGLARTISDGHTIVYLQDILVHPDAQRSGVGGALLDRVISDAAGIRQLVLLTDAEGGQRAFYESRGFVEVHEVKPAPLRSFVRLG
ncbi:GNAT family N-acetyltransferase [Microbacterium sp. NIBRBAC000506063]|uniref:GNAT family N-acetyltransferase n=1 Tax=Microbacterium sp. NIBRBAC000506063 TaxID=2734618 RepID=UPI001CB70A9C|nr:GNAT family N-acetyltransferase [Microbacterium sp. NIBRBAC000506063]